MEEKQIHNDFLRWGGTEETEVERAYLPNAPRHHDHDGNHMKRDLRERHIASHDVKMRTKDDE